MTVALENILAENVTLVEFMYSVLLAVLLACQVDVL